MKISAPCLLAMALLAGLCPAQGILPPADAQTAGDATRTGPSQGVAAYTFPPRELPPPVGACDSYTMQNLPALSVRQKTCYWRAQLITGPAVFGAAFFGAIAMAQDTPREWPQGAQGFGYQFGTRYAQGMLKGTTAYGIGLLFREDPRPKPPYAIGLSHQHIPHTKRWARFGSSLLRVVWTHHDGGSDGPAVSRIAGSFASGFIQMAYLPASQDNVTTALKGTASALGGYGLDSVWAEFQGDIFGWLGKMFATGKAK